MTNWWKSREAFLEELYVRLRECDMDDAANIVFSVYWGDPGSITHIKWLLSRNIRKEDTAQEQREGIERAFKAIVKWSKGERSFEL